MGAVCFRHCTHSICGGDVLRGGLYPSDYRTEKCGAYGGILDFEHGIGGFCAGWLGDIGAGTVFEGTGRVRACICGGDFGAVQWADSKKGVIHDAPLFAAGVLAWLIGFPEKPASPMDRMKFLWYTFSKHIFLIFFLF